MPFRLRTISIVALLALGSSATAAGAEPSASDQEACTPDVFRVCSSAIPTESAIVACLNANVAQLSPQCRAVIDPPHPAAKHKRRARRS